MADLIDRLSGESESMTPERPKLPLHQFIGAYRLYAHGILSRSEIGTEFDLQGDEATQASLLADSIDTETGIAPKISQVLRIEAIMFLVEDSDDTIYHSAGIVNKSKVITDSGI